MRYRFVAALLLIALARPLSACAASPPALVAGAAMASADEATLRGSIARLGAAWNAGSGPDLAAEYWPDGELINILGVVFSGAPAVGAVTTNILAGPFAGSRFASTIRNIRFLSPDVALVETDVEVTNFRSLPPGAVETSPGLLLTRLTHLFARRAGVWHIAFSQNTAVPRKPAPAGA